MHVRWCFSCVFVVIAEPSAAPPLIALSTTTTTALVMWQHLPCFSMNGKIILYKLLLEVEDQSIEEDARDSRLMNVPPPLSIYKISRLKPNTTYKVQISALSAMGPGPWSNPVTFTTANSEWILSCCMEGFEYKLVVFVSLMCVWCVRAHAIISRA